MYRKEMTLKRNFQKLRESPGVRYESVGRGFESLPSHQEKPVHNVYWFFFFGAEEDLNSNDDDRSQRLKQGGVVGAAF